MKRKKLELNRKLFLNKEKVVALSGQEQGNAVGGANTQVGTGPCGMCQYTQAASCNNNCVTVAGATCNADTICSNNTGTGCISGAAGTGCPTSPQNCPLVSVNVCPGTGIGH